jgi:pimeloyl-ACP methyl ester carboxylesterase
VAGDPSLASIEQQLAGQPMITVPSITLDGDVDGVLALGGTAKDASYFAGPHEHRTVPGGGHNLPQEMPEAFAEAILDIQVGRVAKRHV